MVEQYACQIRGKAGSEQRTINSNYRGLRGSGCCPYRRISSLFSIAQISVSGEARRHGEGPQAWGVFFGRRSSRSVKILRASSTKERRKRRVLDMCRNPFIGLVSHL